MADIPWKEIFKLIEWLIEVLGLDKASAISQAAMKFNISESEIKKHLKDK